MLSLGQYIHSKGYKGTASFLTTLLEQRVSFINDETVLEFLDANPEVSTNEIKNSVYKKYFRVKNRKKYTGFEQLAKQDQFHRLNLQNLYKTEISESVETIIGSLNIPREEEYHNVNFQQACIRAAEYHKTQADLYGKKIYVCMSGGLDSEITAISFKQAGIEFIPFIVDYKGKNSFDTSYAFVWCLENQMQARVHVLDIEQFFETEMYEYAKYSKIISPQILTYQKIIDIVCRDNDGYVVMGGEIRAYAKTDKSVVATYAWDKHETHFNNPFLQFKTDEK